MTFENDVCDNVDVVNVNVVVDPLVRLICGRIMFQPDTYLAILSPPYEVLSKKNASQLLRRCKV